MAKDIFESTVEQTAEELDRSQESTSTNELPPELQEEMSNIESLVSIDPSVTETQEYKDLIAKIEAHDSTQASNEEEEEEDSEEEEEEEEDEESEEEDEEEDEEDEEESDIEDVFGVLGKGKKKKKVKVDFDIPDEMKSLLTSRYGIDDPSTFFGSVDSWRKQSQDGAEVKKQLDALSADISNLPPDLRDSISRWADGEDYKAPFTQGERLDFGSDFDEQDIESLVEHYLPEEYNRLIKSFNKEDIEEEELNDKIDLLARSTKKLFTQEKKALVDGRVQYDKRQVELQKELKSSALDSVDDLSKAYPNFSKSDLNKVRNVLVEGKVDSLFYNADGSYTLKAAEAVAGAMFSDKMRETIEKLAKRKGKSEANQEIVDSSPKKLRKQKSSQSKGKVNMKAVEHLTNIVVDNDPYA